MPTIHMGTTVNTLSQSMCEWPPPYIYTVEKTLIRRPYLCLWAGRCQPSIWAPPSIHSASLCASGHPRIYTRSKRH
nr:hypothetical protein MACL_00003294 [Theileria orientalis]